MSTTSEITGRTTVTTAYLCDRQPDMTTSVVLRDTRDAGGSRHLKASIKPNGDLVIEGQDLGPAVEEFFGVMEYEWAWTITAKDCERLRAALGTADLLTALAERFPGENAADLQEFLESEGIPYEVWTRLGD